MLRRLCKSSWYVLFAAGLLVAGASNRAIAGPSVRGGSGHDTESRGAGLFAGQLEIPVDPAPSNVARILVLLPDPNAEVRIDGNEMLSTGMVREFRSPPLEPGRFTYEIRASWSVDGQPVSQFRMVEVSPGSQSVVNFQPD